MSVPYPVPANEEGRLAALADYHLDGTPPEEEFDRIARLAARLFDVPFVVITLISEERQFFKARVGIEACETSREVSFCTHTIVNDDMLVVRDALKDPRFSANPQVVGPPFIRFYAGVPLTVPGGFNIGTLCIVDSELRSTWTEEDEQNLRDLGALVLDHMESRRLDRARHISEARFRNIAANSRSANFCADSEGRITFANRTAETLFGFAPQDVATLTIDGLIAPQSRELFAAERIALGEEGKPEDIGSLMELMGMRRDGSEFPAEFSLSAWLQGDSVAFGLIVRDLTSMRESEERLYRQVRLDPLTQLPNRTAWSERLAETLEAGTPATVLLLDLDGFKVVNDTLGHSGGDHVLKEMTARLLGVCEGAIMVARLNGDEFAVLLPGNEERGARLAAEQIIRALSRPYEVGSDRVEISLGIGISLSDPAISTTDDLFSAADLALYRAKAIGRGRYEIFVPAMREVAAARRAFELELRHAFEKGEFELYYQPQFATADHRVTGAEALIRWNHPQRGLLSPASFIDVLGEKPSAPAVSEWILLTACRQAAEWRGAIPGFRMGVNLFEAQFRAGRILPSVRRVLDTTGLPPEALELEIVENILMRKDPSTITLLTDLRHLGVELAYDDYGTGYASLSQLKKYPISRLKIDRSFVRNVEADEENAALVKVVLHLAQVFGMDVIAEGVETRAELQFLEENGCPEAQGYYFGKPMPASEFARRFIAGRHAVQTQRAIQ